jgi:hypothetical protein
MFSIVDLREAFGALVPPGRATIDEESLVAALNHYDVRIQ